MWRWGDLPRWHHQLHRPKKAGTVALVITLVTLALTAC